MLNPNDLDRDEFGDRGADNFEDDSMINSARSGDVMASDPAADRYGASGGGDANVTNMVDDTSTFGFASVTTSITRETLAGATDTRAGTQATDTIAGDGVGHDVESNSTPETDGSSNGSKRASKKTQVNGSDADMKEKKNSNKSQSPDGAAAGGPNKRRRRLMLIGIGILIIAAILIAVGATVIGGNKSKAASAQGGGTSAPTMTMSPTVSPTTGRPTLSPTSAPTTVRETILADMLKEVIPELAPAAFTAGTDQHRAFGWLVDTDPLQLTPDGTPAMDRRILQRYALSTLFFATEGDTWGNKNNWLSGDECGFQGGPGWFGLGCNDVGEVRAIAFDDNNLFGDLPPELSILTAVENLVIKNNKDLTGTIPLEVGTMTELRQLALYNNDHTGEIPVTIYDNLLHLVYLNLQDNRLTGQLRPEVGQLSSLKKLILFNNELEGPVHSLHIANIDELEYLGLSGNKFSGSIAHQIGNIPSLEYLYLDNNRFTGTLPTKLGLLSSLSKYLFLHGFIRCERMYLCDYLNTPVQYK